MTNSIAEKIIESFGSKSVGTYEACEALSKDTNQDIEQEKTTYIFMDGSKIEMINDECKAL